MRTREQRIVSGWVCTCVCCQGARGKAARFVCGRCMCVRSGCTSLRACWCTELGRDVVGTGLMVLPQWICTASSCECWLAQSIYTVVGNHSVQVQSSQPSLSLHQPAGAACQPWCSFFRRQAQAPEVGRICNHSKNIAGFHELSPTRPASMRNAGPE
jgi:hypothetical protein